MLILQKGSQPHHWRSGGFFALYYFHPAISLEIHRPLLKDHTGQAPSGFHAILARDIPAEWGHGMQSIGTTTDEGGRMDRKATW